MDIHTPIESLPKIGKINSAKLARLGIKTLRDLLYFFPFRYDDFSETKTITAISAGERCNVVGTIEHIHNKRSPQKRINITEALLADETGMIKIIWFNQPFIANTIKAGDKISVSGKVEEDFSGPMFISPTYEKISFSGPIHTKGFVPNYHLTAGLTQKQLRYWINESLKSVGHIDEWLPEEIIKEHHLLTLISAVRQAHFPENKNILAKARQRLAFNELFIIQCQAQLVKLGQHLAKAKPIEFHEEATRNLVASLPFQLTADQRKASWEILLDLAKDKPMMRLLEGDVGSGKTIVATIALYNTALSLYQGALMAPTEILARQHYQSLKKLLSPLDIKIGLLTSGLKLISTDESRKKPKASDITTEADIIIGTHALIQEDARYRNLALVIIDEQHRFGVEQRKALSDKAKVRGIHHEPHLLSMTATPIPRTLALSLYDELAVSVIKELPATRKPIITEVFSADNRHLVYGRIREQIESGRQVFIICPLIDPSDTFGAKSVKEEYERLRNGLFADMTVELLHGKLSGKEKDRVMREFSENKISVLIATAVVEVGIDVPNATIMMIESSERFGLAQLHQYRGRVGRGEHQSYCFLMTDESGIQSQERLSAMLKFSSGFDLAEEDLRFRGPGEVYGILQKGFPELKVASLFDYKLMREARESASWLIKNDPMLKTYPKVREQLSINAHYHLE